MNFVTFSEIFWDNGKEATVDRALDGSTYPGYKLLHSVFGKINYGGLKHDSLYLGLVLPSGGWQSLILKDFLGMLSYKKVSKYIFLEVLWIHNLVTKQSKNCLAGNFKWFFKNIFICYKIYNLKGLN